MKQAHEAVHKAMAPEIESLLRRAIETNTPIRYARLLPCPDYGSQK